MNASTTATMSNNPADQPFSVHKNQGEDNDGLGPCLSVSTACLGPVVPSMEPLKACLSDDSSIEDDSDLDEADDDFYFGDVDFGTSHYNTDSNDNSGSTDASAMDCSPDTSCPAAEKATESTSQLSAPATTTTPPMTANIIRHSYSTGALHRCHPHASTSSLYSSRSTNSGNSKRKNRRRVSINDSVAVVPIPQRSEYSPQVRSSLWSNGQELYQNAARNTIEFATEGYNWRNVTEDENMLRHTVSGELIHPVHLHNALALQKEFQQQQQQENAQQPNAIGKHSNQPQAPSFLDHLPLVKNDGSGTPFAGFSSAAVTSSKGDVASRSSSPHPSPTSSAAVISNATPIPLVPPPPAATA